MSLTRSPIWTWTDRGAAAVVSVYVTEKATAVPNVVSRGETWGAERVGD